MNQQSSFPRVLPLESTSSKGQFTRAERIVITVVGAFLATLLLVAISSRLHADSNWTPSCNTAGAIAQDGPKAPVYYLDDSPTAFDAAKRAIAQSGGSHDIRPLTDRIVALTGGDPGTHQGLWKVPCK